MNLINQLNAVGIQFGNVCRFANGVVDPCKTSPSGTARFRHELRAHHGALAHPLQACSKRKAPIPRTALMQISRASQQCWLGSRRLSPAAVVRWC